MYKKITLLVVIFAALLLNSSAQTITSYSLTSSTAIAVALTSPVNPAITGTTDEGYFNNLPIGFDFWYMGARYTTVSASTNGWLSLGGSITNAAPSNNLTTGGTPRPVIAPLWDDLDVSTATNVSYLTTGTAGNRIFTVQYLATKWSRTATASGINFQVKLYEGTGKIDLIYYQDAGAVAAASASIGLTAAATGSGSFLSLNGTGTAPAASSTTETTTLSAKPANNQVYSFSASAAATPTALTFTAVTSASTTLNWVDNATNELGYVIYRSTDNVNFTYVTQTAANATTSAQSGLTGSTTYYWKVYALKEGLGTALAGSSVTPCTPPAAPGVVSPVNLCLRSTASPLTATGSNLLWGGITGSVGGTAALTTSVYVDNSYNNRKTNFTTTSPNVTITTVDYYVPSYQAVLGLVLSIYNNTGTVIATSSTNTTTTAGATATKVTATFNYNIINAGDYSIGISAGTGNIGYDNPAYPVTESTGTINVTGVNPAGYRCVNNIQFTTPTSATAPTPLTTTAGTKSYYVTQTVGGCTSAPAVIVVNVSGPVISQVPASGIISNFPFTGNANDVSGNNNNGTLQGAPALAANRFGQASQAYSFNGTSQYISTANSYVNPQAFSVSIWFKTATAGGKLIGFGTGQTGQSGQYDRHIYMNNAGQLYFGVYSGAVYTVNSTAAYNDNNWHNAIATMSAATGMVLYVDGAVVGTNASATAAENYTGYWRMGYDNINAWTSQPTNFYYTGLLDDALIYNRAITASEAATIYNSPDGAGNNGPVCAGATLNLTATTLSGATYAWSGPAGFTSSLQNPTLSYTTANAGLYTVVVTVAGCSATAYTNVVSTTTPGQWTGNVSTDWADAGNWCNGVVPTSSTNVTIAAGATRMPSVITTGSCLNLTIANGATVTTTAAGTLNIAGTLTNSGTMVNSGTTNFNGTTGQQTFSGVTTFNHIILNNTAGLLLPSNITVANVTLTAGILNANNFTIDVKGNWLNNASATAFTGGTAVVTFTGTTPQTIGGSFETSFNSITVSNVGSTVTLTNNIKVAGTFVTGGVFDLSTFTANRITSGGTLYVSNTGYLKIGGTNTLPANYTTNTFVTASIVEYSGTNQAVSSQTYGNLIFSSSSGAAVKTSTATPFSTQANFTMTQGAGTSVTFSPLANISFGGDVILGANTIFNGGSYTHTVNGNWTNNGTFNGNTGTITLAGASKAVSGAGAENFNNLTITASGITFSNESISLSGNLATTGSGSFVQASGGTVSMTGNPATISGNSISIDNLTVTGSGKITANNSLTFTGNLTMVNAANTFTGAASTIIKMSGAAKAISGAGSAAFVSLNVTGSVVASTSFSISSGLIVDGSMSATAGTATFTASSSLSGTANLFNTVVNGTKLTLSANAVLGVANVLTITAGTLDVTSSIPNTVNFNGAIAQSINPITYHNLKLSNGNTKTATAGLTVNGDFTIAASTTFAPGAFTHSIFGDWINSGSFTAGSSIIRFAGGNTSNITGATTFTTLTVDKTAATVVVVLQSNVTATLVNMTGGRMNTTASTLTITNTRTGPGIILGNIQRTHAFVSGTDYAFESPYNTINFSSVTGVTSVTVSVVRTTISDFPSGASIGRLYTIAVPAGTYNTKLRLHYEDNELNGNDESTMTLWNYPASAWVSAGASGRDATNNYVELSGLSNIATRWTISGPPVVLHWSGATDTDWNKPGNWTTGIVPGAGDIVDIGVVTFNNQPTISTAVTVKNIIFGSAKAATLSMATGGSLVSGDITGSWSSAATHTINANNQTITINGGLIMSDGVAGDIINLNIGTGTVSVAGTLAQTGNANITFTGAGKLQVGLQFTYTSGVFTAGTGTVEYLANANIIVGNVTYNNLTISKTGGTARVNNAITVNGNLLITSGLLANSNTFTVKGDVTINPGTTLDNDQTMLIGGNWINNGTYDGTGSSTIFNGAGAQSISATTFNDLTINKAAGSLATLTGDVTIKGNLVGTSGILDIKSFFFNRDVAGGSATISDNGVLIIGADNAPTQFANYNLSVGSTVVFNGTGTQHLALPGVVYGNLTFRNSGTKLLYTPITVNGKLLIEPTADFEAGANTITLNGDWENNGIFVPQTSTVLWNGTNKTITGATTFNKVTVNGKYDAASNLVFNDLFNVTASGAVTAGAGRVNTLKGDLINSGDLYLLGETIFTGDVLQTLSLMNAVRTYAVTITFNGTVSPVLNSTSAPQFAILNINNTGGVNPSIGWNIFVQLNVSAGASFNGGPYTQNLYGNLTNNGVITTSGTFNFIPTAAATINMGTGFTSTGTAVLGGAGAMTLAGTPVSFRNVTISNTNVAGVTPSSNWLLTNNFTINSGSIFNASTYNYTVGGNIKNSGTFTKGSSLFTLNGTGTQDISSLNPFNNVTINKSSGSTTISSDVTVSNVLNITSGIITTGSNTLIQPAGATLTGAGGGTGWINGKLQKNVATGATSRIFEVGSAASYTPATISFASVSVAGDLVVNTTSAEHPSISSSTINANKSLNRYWTLNNKGITFSNYTALLNFVAGDVDAGASTGAFHEAVYNGSSWSVPNTTIANATNITATGLSMAGDIAVGEICNFGTAISYPSVLYCGDGGTATPTVTGTTGGVFAGDNGLVINASTGVIDLAASPAGVHVVTYTVASTADCGQYLTNKSITIGTPGLWSGANGTDWNTPGNWSCGTVPLTTADVTIPGGLTNYPNIIVNESVHNITIQSGGSILVTDAAFSVSGNISNAGKFDISGGTLTMNGTAAQTIPSNAFFNNAVDNLVVANTSAAGVSLAGPVDLYTSVTYTGTGKKLVTNDLLTLKSTALNTARIGIVTGNTITGKVTVERYLGAHKAWRFLSVPTNTLQTVKAAWQEGAANATENPVPGFGTIITGTGGSWAANGFDMLTSTPGMKLYNNATDAYDGIAATNAGTINTTSGYMIFVRGDRTVKTLGTAATPTVLRTKGELYTGTQAAINVPANKFTAIGNPYASQIDVRNISTNGLKEFFYLWDPNLGGAYGYGGYQTFSFNGSDYVITPGGGSYGPGGSVTNYIPSGYAFFVQATAAGGKLTFDENVKTSANTNTSGSARITKAQLRTNLYTVVNDTTSVLDDGLLVNFEDDYSNSIDDLDAIKTVNTGENFAVRNTGKLLSVERKHTITDADTIYLNMTNVKLQQYRMDIVGEQMATAGLTGYLIDNYLQTSTALDLTGTTSVPFTVQNVAGSYAADRFKIIFKQAVVLPVTITNVKAYQQNTNINVEWKVENETNIKQYETEKSADGRSFNTLAATGAKVNGGGAANYLTVDTRPLEGINYYRIKTSDANGKVSFTNVVKVLMGKGTSGIEVFPNPIVNGVVSVQLNNMPAGDYKIYLMNNLGQKVFDKKIAHNQGNSTELLSLDQSIVHGIYQLEIIKPDGSKVTKEIIY